MFENAFSPFGATVPTATQPYGYPINPYAGFPQIQPQPAQVQQAPMSQQTNTNKLFVSGMDEVRNKPLPPNSEYIFLDNDKSILYQKTVDSKGQFEVKAFDILPHQEEPAQNREADMSGFVPRSEFDALKARIEALEGGVKE